MAKKNKYYVVWVGYKPGVYDSWSACQLQTKGFPGAKFKGFDTKILAENAYNEGFIGYEKLSPSQKVLFSVDDNSPKPVYPSLAVDAAWNTATLEMEYRGVVAQTGTELFKQGPYPDATNNIGEFLAIVHVLAMLSKGMGLPDSIMKIRETIPVYSDSKTAISWVRNKRANTKLKPTAKNRLLFNLVARAENWLRENSWKNPLLKWETKVWGEIPADFGRK
ncbi:MAG: viroplasmin family protein [Bacteroidales bacterium]|nr:viroplasmin family protein [Bacteroidales bacterium]HPD95078.1 ribonuclease H family protein [Tenuifilaceae bacterium]HRX30393.1 ribonuclease H family protein [Tenuifilaceae bacterium]